DGITAEDHHLADIVKQGTTPCIFVVNKVDNEQYYDQNDIYSLGFTDPVEISAVHGLAIDVLLDRICAMIPEVTGHTPPAVDFSLCIIGEPNAGKSTLLNRLLQEERAIVSEIAGTTRDSIEEVIEHGGCRIRLIDTAGIKRKRKVHDSTSVFSLSRAKEAIRKSDIVLVLFDAEKGPQRDTRALFEFIEQWKKTVLLVVNKWDLVKGVEMAQYERELKELNAFLRYLPVLFISALNGRNVDKIMDHAITLWKRYTADIKTSILNDLVARLNNDGTLPSHLKIKYMTQIGHKPPSFMAFVNSKKIVTDNHYHHIINQVVETFDLNGVQINLIIKES
ncbi:MAG: ribosome biogenesis GTPase Der, partial [Candidatus Omnitrophica bacterium]|nr:ribosome biogenesis GTPase Der [Candidatus Omnitrophota bacterium]